MTLQINHLRYLAIEGVIGVGKTSLTRKIQEAVDGRLFLEEFEVNPFLEDFYEDPEHYAFQTQLFFLLSRFRQQEQLLQYDLFKSQIIADYMFQKDRIFATLNLNEKELTLYNMLARILEKRIVKPDLVLYLRAGTERLMANIEMRGRAYEKDMKRDYIENLNRLYDEFFWNYDETPLLIINTENLDFVNNDKHLDQIFQELGKPVRGKRSVNFDL